MEKIPTVMEFLISKGLPGFAEHTTIKHHMIEFAKLHVEAALKEALNKVEIVMINLSDIDEPSINANSILNSYSLDNIK